MNKKRLILQEVQMPMDWLDFINDDSHKLVVPVGTPFQANVSAWNGQPNYHNYASDTSKWLGTKIWPNNTRSSRTSIGVGVGKGRSDSCRCRSPGSEICIKRHINDATIQLRLNLGAAFQIWKFDAMGERVSKKWSTREQRKFESLVRSNPLSEGKCFLKAALECFPSKSRETIVSYYLNVFIPRRISMQTRSGQTEVDSDDGDIANENSCIKGSRKRSGNNNVGLPGAIYLKTPHSAKPRL